jgi:hypothetical protein
VVLPIGLADTSDLRGLACWNDVHGLGLHVKHGVETVDLLSSERPSQTLPCATAITMPVAWVQRHQMTQVCAHVTCFTQAWRDVWIRTAPCSSSPTTLARKPFIRIFLHHVAALHTPCKVFCGRLSDFLSFPSGSKRPL